ncbi:MAG: RDD family protein [Candidatus Bathyarchaeia archaeon]
MSHPADHQNHDKHEVSIENLSTPPLKISPAPVGKRFAAGILDSIIIGVVWFALVSVQHQNPTSYTTRLTLNEAYLGILVFVYYFLQEGLFATTIGKTLLKLHVVDRSGDPCSFASSFKRNILRFVDWLPAIYILAVVIILASHERLRLGDIVAKTIVTLAPEKDTNPPPAPFLFH